METNVSPEKLKNAIIEAMQGLDPQNKGCHYKTIVQQLMLQPMFSSEDPEKFSNRISGCLNRGAKSSNGRFMQVSNGKKNRNGKVGHKAGVYKLRPEKKEPDIINPDKPKIANKTGNDTPTLFSSNLETKTIRISQITKINTGDDKPVKPFGDNVTASHIGKGGEFAVMSELLYRGFYANSTAVDNGIDIIAYKDDKVFLVQVKTTGIDSGEFKYSIKKESFDRYNQSNIFYVFVMRYIENGKPVSQYLVFPSALIQHYIDNGLISETANKTYEIKFRVQGSKIYIKNKGYESNIAPSNLNRFDLIK